MQRHAQFRLAHPRKLLRLADDRARHVEGDVAAADDDDFAAERHAETQVDVQQELNRPQHAVELHAFDGQLAALVRADAEEHRLVALLLQVRQRRSPARAGGCRRISTPSDSMASISARMISRGSRYSGTPSTSIPPARLCASNTVGENPINASSCAQDSPAGPAPTIATLRPPPMRLAARVAQFGIDAAKIEVVRLDAELFADKPFQRADGNGGVERPAAAFGLAGRGANAPADGGERVGVRAMM